MKAVDTFDATRKARFSTYASRCIENEIRMQFRRERKNGQTVSLQEALEADGDSALTLADVIQDGFCMEDSCERQEDVRRLRQLLDTLPARERQILLLRYGLAGQPPLTQLETAGLLGISRSYVSRLETHALELLRQAWAKTASFHSCKIFNCNSSSCSKVYSRLKASTSSFLERRGGSPSAFKSLTLRSALPACRKAPLVQISIGDLPSRRAHRRGSGFCAQGVQQCLPHKGVIHALYPSKPSLPGCALRFSLPWMAGT